MHPVASGSCNDRGSGCRGHNFEKNLWFWGFQTIFSGRGPQVAGLSYSKTPTVLPLRTRLCFALAGLVPLGTWISSVVFSPLNHEGPTAYFFAILRSMVSQLGALGFFFRTLLPKALPLILPMLGSMTPPCYFRVFRRSDYQTASRILFT